jgi:hypothetical protein
MQANAPASAYLAIKNAGIALDKKKVTRTGRILVVSPDVLSILLEDDKLIKFDAANTDGALRDAQVGRLSGFNIFVSNNVNGAVGFVRETFALVVRAPRKPEGAPFAASADGNGYALRYLRDYNSDTLTDRSIVSTLMGVTTLDANRAVGLKITTGA